MNIDEMSAPKTQTKRPAHRPTGYRKEFVEQVTKICELGATIMEVANFFKVSHETIRRWRLQYPEFNAALKTGTYSADDRTQMSLYHRANGYTFEAEELFIHKGKVIRAKVLKHVPPDTTAMIFWLKNRRPAEWRDRQENVSYDVHMSLADLIGQSYQEPKLVEGKVIESDDEKAT
jgi:hypothetical protein